VSPKRRDGDRAVASETRGAVMPRYTIVPAAGAPSHHGTVAILSATEQGGQWPVARRNRAVAVPGSASLDLREADIPDGESEIEISACSEVWRWSFRRACAW
jgi:hypothetical protein